MIDKTPSPARVTLHPFGREDFSRLISWLPTEAALIEWCAAFFKYPLTEAQLERYLESSRQPNSRVIFTARSDGDEAVGHIEISQIWPRLSTRLSRILVSPTQRRRGFASSMVAQALSVSFDQYFVDRVDLGVSATNSAAIGCYAKLGFRQVGTWPNAIVAGPSTLDVVWMTVGRILWFTPTQNFSGGCSQRSVLGQKRTISCASMPTFGGAPKRLRPRLSAPSAAPPRPRAGCRDRCRW